MRGDHVGAAVSEDLNILRTTAKYNNVIAGIRLSVIQGGPIHQDAPVWLEAIATDPA